MPNSWAINSAREPAGILDDDRPHAVALNSIKKRRKARSCLDGVRTGDGCIIELRDDFQPGLFGEALDGMALAFLAVLVGADVGGR
jgi:hypothetical protein